jgi:hypothetical protein
MIVIKNIIEAWVKLQKCLLLFCICPGLPFAAIMGCVHVGMKHGTVPCVIYIVVMPALVAGITKSLWATVHKWLFD